MRYKVHRKIMDRHSDVVADANGTSIIDSDGLPDVLKLAASAQALDLLFSIVYRLDSANQNLRRADFRILTEVAEAAEKYSFEMVSDICEMHMWCALFSDLPSAQSNGISVSPANSTPQKSWGSRFGTVVLTQWTVQPLGLSVCQ
jgi:hypothetical protein